MMTYIPCAVLEFVENTTPIREIVTKFGGYPIWLTEQQWPLSKSTGKPMQFIGQVVLDQNIFLAAEGSVAYIFMADDSEDYIEGTWESDSGENAVIIQPGSIPDHIKIATLAEGPTLDKEYSVNIKFEKEPRFIPEFERYKLSDKDIEEYNLALKVNKIGGTPNFLQGDSFPEGDDWNLLLQLDSTKVPFYINFGDAGICYVFINKAGTEGKFIWQCC